LLPTAAPTTIVSNSKAITLIRSEEVASVVAEEEEDVEMEMAETSNKNGVGLETLTISSRSNRIFADSTACLRKVAATTVIDGDLKSPHNSEMAMVVDSL